MAARGIAAPWASGPPVRLPAAQKFMTQVFLQHLPGTSRSSGSWETLGGHSADEKQ